MNKVMLYPVNKAVGFDITAALIQAVGMESMPLVANGRQRALDGIGSYWYLNDTKKLPDSMESGSFLQLLSG